MASVSMEMCERIVLEVIESVDNDLAKNFDEALSEEPEKAKRKLRELTEMVYYMLEENEDGW